MNRLLCSLVVSLWISSVLSKPITKGCKCWDGYESNDDDSECVGIFIPHVMQCNLPQPPVCKCSGIVSSILKDRTGIWCTTYKGGKELKRWKCQNKDEWKKFYEQHPEYKYP